MSTTYIANIVTFLTLVLPVFGVHIVDTDAFTTGIMQVVGVLSTAYVFYGRYKAGGINIFGLRTN